MSAQMTVRLARPDVSVMHYGTGVLMTFFEVEKDSQGNTVWVDRQSRKPKFTTARATYRVSQSPYYIRRIKDGALEEVKGAIDQTVDTRAPSAQATTEAEALRRMVNDRDSELRELRSAFDKLKSDALELADTNRNLEAYLRDSNAELRPWRTMVESLENIPNGISDDELRSLLIERFNGYEDEEDPDAGPDVG